MAKTDIYLNGKNLLECEWSKLSEDQKRNAIMETQVGLLKEENQRLKSGWQNCIDTYHNFIQRMLIWYSSINDAA